MNFNSSIIRIIERTLNYVDPRLMDHGKRVSYLVYRAYKRLGVTDRGYLRKVIMTSFLHDIGAYKTDEIDDLFRFEIEGVWNHSVYGYLFIKYFSPLRELAPAVLFHHANCGELKHLTPQFHELAQMLHIADRFDVLAQTKTTNTASFRDHFYKRSGSRFLPEQLNLFFADFPGNVFDEMDTDEEFSRALYDPQLSNEDVYSYLKMIVLSIDFRSPQTVTHTFTTAKAGRLLSTLIGIDEERADRIYTGVLLHDIGKIAIPHRIIEKNGKLTDDEMEIMKDHVSITEDILTGMIDEDIINLAVRHHEKLDGSGYPKGLTMEELSMEERAIAVADIFSALCTPRSYKDAFPKERVVGILSDMQQKGLLDEKIVSLTIDNFDMLADEIKKTTAPIVDAYERLRTENIELLEIMSNLNETEAVGCMQV